MDKIHLQLRKMSGTWFCIALIGLAVTSCMEKDVFKGPGESEEEVPNLFDFSTKSNVTINLDYGTNYDVSFEMYYSNPLRLDENKGYVKNADMKPFIAGKTNAKGKFKIDFADMPNTEKDIYVYSPNLTVPVLLHGTVNGNEVIMTAETSKAEALPYASTRGSATGSYYDSWTTRNCKYQTPLGAYDVTGLPSYLNQGDDIEQHKLELTEKFTRTIKGTLETDVPTYSMYLNHEYITISEAANVYINFVSHNNSERNNALAYYVLDENQTAPEFSTPPTNLTIAFPNLNAEGLKGGDVIQLQYYDKTKEEWTKAFPAGCRIGFVLLVDVFNNGNIENSSINLMYSDRKYNSFNIINGSQGGNRPQMFAFMADNKLVLSFEDQPWHEHRKKGEVAHGDFSDDIFTITANPIKALPDDVPAGTDPEEPEEEVANLNISSAGILAFEDNWPRKGDYDMNDVVFSYQRTLNIKIEGDNYRLLSVDEEYVFKNNGASFINGFGYEIGGNVKRTDVDVTVTSDKQYAGQGVDNDLEKATVMLTGNTKDLAVGTTFKVKTKFKSKEYTYTHIGLNPYNPFIVVLGYDGGDYLATDRTEVHLSKKYKPTPKADKALFHTANDLSIDDKYYVSSGDYPFALEISAAYNSLDIPNFKIPTEQKPIDETYPKFIDWVKNPKDNADWWKN